MGIKKSSLRDESSSFSCAANADIADLEEEIDDLHRQMADHELRYDTLIECLEKAVETANFMLIEREGPRTTLNILITKLHKIITEYKVQSHVLAGTEEGQPCCTPRSAGRT